MQFYSSIKKNAQQTVRVQRTEFGGRTRIDVRIWGEDNQGTMQPWKKGLSLSPSQWRNLLPSIEAAIEDFEAEVEAQMNSDT